MTAKDVCEKMIIGEIKPENALSFFRTYANEHFAKILISMNKYTKPLTTDEQWRNMISPGSVALQRKYDAKQDANQLKIESFLISQYIKEAESMITKQKKETVERKEEATPEQSESAKETHEQKVLPIIKELIGALQLKPEPKEGRYIPTNSIPQFIKWIVENKYDEYLNQNNFLKFIYCDLKEETIKRYFRDAININSK
jgi:hypothetical protein